MEKPIAVVTGANRGIGMEICRQLAHKDVTVILTARDEVKGEAATSILAKENCDVQFYQLDITCADQIQKLIDYVQSKFQRLDILVNNAGVYLDQELSPLSINADTIRQSIETDVCGTFSMSKAVIPLMKKNNYGRIVNLSSTLSFSVNMNDGVGLSYKICKAAINVMTAVLSDAVKDYNILINAAAPGWVRTDMGGEQAPFSLKEGAETPVWLATLPDNSPSGGLFFNRERLLW